jgi:uncharacterized membrane protein
MFNSNTKKTVVAGLMLAIGFLLPLLTSHSIVLLPGNVFLPMHIPVLLCGFFCGPLYGALLGLILPFLNSFLTSMPLLYPNAIVMSGELFTYGLMTSLIYKFTGYSGKLRHIYPTLIISMISGRVVYGIVAGILLFFNPAMKKLSVIGAIIQGVPGIIIQLILIPVIVSAIYKNISKKHLTKSDAIRMIEDGSKSCVVVRDNKIINTSSSKGISHILKLYETGVLTNTYVADAIIGKAAAMIFSLSGVKGCYGHIMSKEALNWLNSHNIEATYNTLTDNIINRKGDGICPMEATVADVNDEKTAVVLLKAKIEELQKKSSAKQEEIK